MDINDLNLQDLFDEYENTAATLRELEAHKRKVVKRIKELAIHEGLFEILEIKPARFRKVR